MAPRQRSRKAYRHAERPASISIRSEGSGEAPQYLLPTTAPATPELAPPKFVLAKAAREWEEPVSVGLRNRDALTNKANAIERVGVAEEWSAFRRAQCH
ncbi:MAG TPA: hypothetical protein VKP30_22105 [Polyangiaceae bacterium]|nr:hypothetical protein [Polyangiaceae bacterium]